MYDLVIIGGGPAGLASAVYAARKRLNTLLISQDIGGQVVLHEKVENYPGYQLIQGTELIEKFYQQVGQYPIEQKIGTRAASLKKETNGFKIAAENGDLFETRSVILATGKRPRRLEVPGEDNFEGKGVTYCSICDGPLFAGKVVAIIGGSNHGLEAALDMANIGEKVYLVAWEITGDKVLLKKCKNAKNIEIFGNHQVTSIEGDQFVTGIHIKDRQKDEIIELKVGGVFVEIGMIPNSGLVKDMIKLNDRAEIPIGCSGQTEIDGLFAAGDVTNAPEKQIIVAAGEGAKAALQAHRYLQFLPKS